MCCRSLCNRWSHNQYSHLNLSLHWALHLIKCEQAKISKGKLNQYTSSLQHNIYSLRSSSLPIINHNSGEQRQTYISSISIISPICTESGLSHKDMKPSVNDRTMSGRQKTLKAFSLVQIIDCICTEQEYYFKVSFIWIGSTNDHSMKQVGSVLNRSLQLGTWRFHSNFCLHRKLLICASDHRDKRNDLQSIMSHLDVGANWLALRVLMGRGIGGKSMRRSIIWIRDSKNKWCK